MCLDLRDHRTRVGPGYKVKQNRKVASETVRMQARRQYQVQLQEKRCDTILTPVRMWPQKKGRERYWILPNPGPRDAPGKYPLAQVDVEW